MPSNRLLIIPFIVSHLYAVCISFFCARYIKQEPLLGVTGVLIFILSLIVGMSMIILLTTIRSLMERINNLEKKLQASSLKSEGSSEESI